MSKSKVVLILVHQGLSYIPFVQRTLVDHGIGLVALSSRAENNAPFYQQGEFLQARRMARNRNLSWDDVSIGIAEFSDQFELIAVISTFEGYRLWMSRANAQLGVQDCAETRLQCALDKLCMRSTLRQHSLSTVYSEVLTQQSLTARKACDNTHFVKPRCGVGSFGCFTLTANSNWQDIETLEAELKTDHFLECAYFDNHDFIVESFIDGIECSFEIVADDNRYYTLAVHEKIGVVACDMTILETVDVSPCLNLDSQQMQSGNVYAARCLEALVLKHGVFHVEAKYDKALDTWEIIEINPRIGGGLINDSVGAITGGTTILDAWLLALTREHHSVGISDLFAQLHTQFLTSDTATISHYCFGPPAGTIRHIERVPGIPEPLKMHEHAKPGETLPKLSRELPVIEGLWAMDSACLEHTLAQLNEGWVDIVYEH